MNDIKNEPNLSLLELVALITPENCHEEILNDLPQGLEQI